MSLSCECCLLSGKGLCVGLIMLQRNLAECVVSECDREASITRITTDRFAMEKKLRPTVTKDKLYCSHCYMLL
jgi:hypothetical protein